MTKFLNKFKEPCFGPFFGPFSKFFGQKIFLQKIWLSCTTSYSLLAPCKNLEKNNDTNPRKRLERQKEFNRTIFYRTLSATAGNPVYIMSLLYLSLYNLHDFTLNLIPYLLKSAK